MKSFIIFAFALAVVLATVQSAPAGEELEQVDSNLNEEIGQEGNKNIKDQQ